MISGDRAKYPLIVRAPGRICLLGEHQDYLGLEVISGAMDRYVELAAIPADRKQLVLKLTRMGTTRMFQLDQIPQNIVPRDYLASGLRVMMAEGYRFHQGYEIEIRGDLPIGKGVSSSSAMCVGWIMMLSMIADVPRVPPPLEIARLAFHTEVVSFNEPGGMQDHIASAIGGLIHMDFRDGRDRPVLTDLQNLQDGFRSGMLLVDSDSTKETIGMIQSIRRDVLESMSRAAEVSAAGMQLADVSLGMLDRSFRRDPQNRRMIATIINRNLVRSFRATATRETPPAEIGAFIQTHHHILSSMIGSSSARIDELCKLTVELGASGAKVIGSGGGGCLLVYAPLHHDRVERELNRRGIRVDSIHIGPGVHRVDA